MRSITEIEYFFEPWKRWYNPEMFSDMSGGYGERIQQPEAPIKLEARKLKSADEVMDAIERIGGENMLREHGAHSSDRGKWKETLTSEIIDGGGFPLVLSTDGKDVAVVIADKTGTVTRVYTQLQNREAVFEAAFKKIIDEGIPDPKVRVSKEDETMRTMFKHMGYGNEEESGDDDRKVTLKKG